MEVETTAVCGDCSLSAQAHLWLWSLRKALLDLNSPLRAPQVIRMTQYCSIATATGVFLFVTSIMCMGVARCHTGIS